MVGKHIHRQMSRLRPLEAPHSEEAIGGRFPSFLSAHKPRCPVEDEGPRANAVAVAPTEGLLVALLGVALAAMAAIVHSVGIYAGPFGHLLLLAVFVPLLFGALAVVAGVDGPGPARHKTVLAAARAWVITILLVLGGLAAPNPFSGWAATIDPTTNQIFWMGAISFVCAASLLSVNKRLATRLATAAVVIMVVAVATHPLLALSRLETIFEAAVVAIAFGAAGLRLDLSNTI